MPISWSRIERIGLKDSIMTVANRSAIQSSSHNPCVSPALDCLKQSTNGWDIRVIAHRVVHGEKRYSQSQRFAKTKFLVRR